MNPNFLDFEWPTANLQAKIEELCLVGNDNALNTSDEIPRLQDKSRVLTGNTFGNLFSRQITQFVRHPKRLYILDYIGHLFSDSEELHGDRHFTGDPAIVGGVAYLNGSLVMIIGHQKGREVREEARRNSGMPCPESYHKACRLMEMAECFRMPILILTDTPGTYSGIDVEEHGQSGATAWNLWVMARLKTSIIAIVTGEGGSGGMLTIDVCSRLNTLQYSIYSMISPGDCASVLWKTVEKAPGTVEAMDIITERLRGLDIVDKVTDELLSDAYYDPVNMVESICDGLLAQLKMLQDLETDELLEHRYDCLISYGAP